MAGLPKLNFIKDATKGSAFDVYSYPEPCEINLKHKGNALSKDKWKLVAVDTHLPVVAAHPGNQLDFVDVSIPPFVSLAHELGHYLQYLTAYKKVMDCNCKCVSESIVVTDAVLSPRIQANRFAIKTNYNTELSSRLDNPIDFYFELQWKEIMSGIIPDHPPLSPAQEAFEKVWNGDLPEVSNYPASCKYTTRWWF
jgi:hypothetical protein